MAKAFGPRAKVRVVLRNGKRVVDVTEPGRVILGIAERILQDSENLKQVGREFRDQAAGTLTSRPPRRTSPPR